MKSDLPPTLKRKSANTGGLLRGFVVRIDLEAISAAKSGNKVRTNEVMKTDQTLNNAKTLLGGGRVRDAELQGGGVAVTRLSIMANTSPTKNGVIR